MANPNYTKPKTDPNDALLSLSKSGDAAQMALLKEAQRVKGKVAPARGSRSPGLAGWYEMNPQAIQGESYAREKERVDLQHKRELEMAAVDHELSLAQKRAEIAKASGVGGVQEKPNLKLANGWDTPDQTPGKGQTGIGGLVSDYVSTLGPMQNNQFNNGDGQPLAPLAQPLDGLDPMLRDLRDAAVARRESNQAQVGLQSLLGGGRQQTRSVEAENSILNAQAPTAGVVKDQWQESPGLPTAGVVKDQWQESPGLPTAGVVKDQWQESPGLPTATSQFPFVGPVKPQTYPINAFPTTVQPSPTVGLADFFRDTTHAQVKSQGNPGKEPSLNDPFLQAVLSQNFDPGTTTGLLGLLGYTEPQAQQMIPKAQVQAAAKSKQDSANKKAAEVAKMRSDYSRRNPPIKVPAGFENTGLASLFKLLNGQ